MLILFEVQQPTFGFPKRHILAVKAPTINSWEPGAAAKGAVNSTPLWDGVQWCYPNEWIPWSFCHSNKKPIKTSFTKHQGFISPQINSSEYTLIFLPVGMWVWSFALLSCCQNTIPNNSTPQEKLKGYIQNHSKINGTSARLGRGFGICFFFWGGWARLGIFPGASRANLQEPKGSNLCEFQKVLKSWLSTIGSIKVEKNYIELNIYHIYIYIYTMGPQNQVIYHWKNSKHVGLGGPSYIYIYKLNYFWWWSCGRPKGSMIS